MNYKEALAKAVHLKALDQTVVFLDNDAEFPYKEVKTVRAGGAYRLSGPVSCYLTVTAADLDFQLCVDFEHRDAEGSSVNQFDREKLRAVMDRLNPTARLSFTNLLKNEVLPKVEETTPAWKVLSSTATRATRCGRSEGLSPSISLSTFSAATIAAPINLWTAFRASFPSRRAITPTT